MAFPRESRVRPVLVVFPLVLSLAGFVLAMIALFAGTGPQQQAMEKYHLIAINMSNFGHDLVPTQTSSSSPKPTATDGGILGDIEGSLHNLGDDIGNEISGQLNNITGDIADKIAGELGISQWYSLHIMTVCEGNFAPNATAPSASYNTTNCTAQAPGVRFNLTDMLYKEIKVGPLNLKPADIPIPDDIQTSIDYLNKFLLTTFVFFALASGFSGLSFLSCILVLSLRRNSIGRGTVLANIFLAALAAFTLMIGSAIATGISKKGVAEINDKGSDVGISAIEGTHFITLSWVAFAFMSVTLLFWGVALSFPPLRTGSAAYVEKGHRTRRSTQSNRGLLGIFQRRR